MNRENTNKSDINDTTWDFRGEDTKNLTHGFHNYPAMMIPQVARRLMREYKPSTGKGILLDPFCGSGTSLVEAKVHGLNAYGIDINPLARLIAHVKTNPIPHSALEKTLQSILWDFDQEVNRADISIPDLFNLDYWFAKPVAVNLQALANAIGQVDDINIKDFFLIPFSETVREVSYTRNSEFKLYRIPQNRLAKHNPNVINVFHKKALRNIQGMQEFNRVYKERCWTRILDEDTRLQTSIPESSVDLVVTSPPYGDSKTTVAYGQYSRLSLQWLGYDYKETRSIDKKALGGVMAHRQDVASLSVTLAATIDLVAKSDERRADEVYSFYKDFEQCFIEIARVVKSGGYVCLVVGNRTVKGIRIPTDQIFIDMSTRHGLKYLKTIYRNIPNKRLPLRNSPSNVAGMTSPTILKESIVILRKE